MISGVTALTIKNNPAVKCDFGGPSEENGKYVGWIVLDIGRWHPLLNTKAVFDTGEQAKAAMEELCRIVRKSDEVEALGDELLNILTGPPSLD